jgi:uncharacterized SAM-binding protein YcdF (DUF218 family)
MHEAIDTTRDETLTPDLVREINARLLVQTPLVPADFLFVFGTREGVAEFVDAIVKLWRGGFCRHILISGGPTWNNDDAEAFVLRRAVVAAGVPDNIILIEPQATNTGENVLFSLPVIDEQIGLRNIRSVIALGKVCTSVRYLMTLQKHWPEVDKMLAPVNYFGHSIEQWQHHPVARARILREWRKLEPYKAAGFIAEWP